MIFQFSSAFLFAASVEHVPALPKVYMYAAAQAKQSITLIGYQHVNRFLEHARK